jgi:DNA adenine methylase
MSGHRPFLKWAGGKYRLMPRINALLPKGKRLVEPFMGSGAVFLNTQYPNYLLADSNPDLIALYHYLQHNSQGFITAAKALFTQSNNHQVAYNDLRQQFNALPAGSRERAPLFLYLNRHGYNGLCRYNQRGGFNVPFGRYARPYFPEEELHAFINKCEQINVQFMCADFNLTLAQCLPGDVVYADPPYVPLSASAKFTDYATGGFGQAQHQQLTDWALRLSQQQGRLEKGVPVLLSNHDTPATRQWYRSAQWHSLDVQRNISCKGSQRKTSPEVLALFSPSGI